MIEKQVIKVTINKSGVYMATLESNTKVYEIGGDEIEAVGKLVVFNPEALGFDVTIVRETKGVC